METIQRLSATVVGRVQGVGFRAYTQRAAHSLKLVGWVRNQLDGHVEVIAEGSPEALRRLEAFLRVGPPGSLVETVSSEWSQAQNEFQRFEIRY